MTPEEAREEIPDIQSFLYHACSMCNANDWYCTGYCEDLTKAQKMPFSKILEAYARHDGEMWKVMRYIKNARY